jgi:hypothetical protein
MDAKPVRRQELLGTPIDDPKSASLIDDFYTDFDVAEDDRACLETFLNSSVVEVRREALIALIFSTGRGGPKFTGYALDALMLHVLAIVNGSEALLTSASALDRLDVSTLVNKMEPMLTGVSVLTELESRGDKEAAHVLQSLAKNDEWRRRFRGISVGES